MKKPFDYAPAYYIQFSTSKPILFNNTVETGVVGVKVYGFSR